MTRDLDRKLPTTKLKTENKTKNTNKKNLKPKKIIKTRLKSKIVTWTYCHARQVQIVPLVWHLVIKNMQNNQILNMRMLATVLFYTEVKLKTDNVKKGEKNCLSAVLNALKVQSYKSFKMDKKYKKRLKLIAWAHTFSIFMRFYRLITPHIKLFKHWAVFLLANTG